MSYGWDLPSPVEQAVCFACSDPLRDGDWGDPGIYTLMKTIMGNMLICPAVVG